MTRHKRTCAPEAAKASRVEPKECPTCMGVGFIPQGLLKNAPCPRCSPRKPDPKTVRHG